MSSNKSSTRSEFEQNRARHAFQRVQDAKAKLKEEEAKEYKAYAKKVPMLIKANGLGNVLAFIEAKAHKNKAWAMLSRHIEEWLFDSQQHLLEFERGELLRTLLNANSPTYRAVSQQVLTYLGWIKRFAEGQIAGEAKEENN
jgi:CRISPR-associated protein Cmr5